MNDGLCTQLVFNYFGSCNRFRFLVMFNLGECWAFRMIPKNRLIWKRNNWYEFNSAVTPDDMWTPYKQLHKVVETYLIGRAPEGSISNLELMLQKHKPDFINVLKNSVIRTFRSRIESILRFFSFVFSAAKKCQKSRRDPKRHHRWREFTWARSNYFVKRFGRRKCHHIGYVQFEWVQSPRASLYGPTANSTSSRFATRSCGHSIVLRWPENTGHHTEAIVSSAPGHFVVHRCTARGHSAHHHLHRHIGGQRNFK